MQLAIPGHAKGLATPAGKLWQHMQSQCMPKWSSCSPRCWWQAHWLAPAPAGKLLAAFTGPWYVKMQRLPPTPDMAAAALQPVLVSAQRADLAHADELAPVELCFGGDPSAPNAEQLQDICQVCDPALSMHGVIHHSRQGLPEHC